MITSFFLTNFKNYYRSFKFRITLALDYCYDFQRFFRFSATIDPYKTKNMLQGRIIAHYHVIEKGLSLKNPRPGFGAKIVNKLLILIKKYNEKYGLDEVSQVAVNVLFSYYKFNLIHKIDNQELYQQLVKLKEKNDNQKESSLEGGTITVTKEDIHKSALIDFHNFVNTRHSIRNFADSYVDIDLIEKAVSMAMKTPSVCNRQTWKVYVYSDENLKNQILSHQNGNRGFGEYVNKVLVITSDLSYFIDSSERNQCFVDGGLFAMSLIYSLHSLGLGSCCLNWCVNHKTDKSLRKDARIPDSETVIMMLAVGHIPDKLSVANSPRKKIEDVLIIN
jgi:nitroreductase